MTNEITLMTFFLLLTVYYKRNSIHKKTLSISPEMLISYAGMSWDSVSGRFKNKKHYWYNSSNNRTTFTGISLPAIDPAAPVLNYDISIELNVQNKVSMLHVNCTDTINIETGNKLFLYYYEKVFVDSMLACKCCLFFATHFFYDYVRG